MLTSHIVEQAGRERLVKSTRARITAVPATDVEAHAVNDDEHDAREMRAAP